MPFEVLKVAIVAIISFSIGSTYVNGRQSIEISQLNNKINDLQEQLETYKKQVSTEQFKTKKQQELVKKFQKEWQQAIK